MVFATETPVLRNSWGEPYQEILACQSLAVRLDRLNAGGPVLVTHGTYSITNQLGVVVRSWIDDATREAKATLQLSQRPEWKGVVDDIAVGIIRNVSVGHNIFQFDVDDTDATRPPIYRAVDWEPSEISFAAVPAGYMSGSRTSNLEENTVTIKYMKGKNMTDAEREALVADRKRTVDIFAACRATGLTWEYTQSLIDTDLSTADALTEVERKRAVEPVNESAVRAQERTRITEIRKVARMRE